VCGEDLGIAQFSPGDSEKKPALCRPCELVPPAFTQAVAFGVYEGPLRSQIHLLKYDRIEPVARGLASRLAPQVARIMKLAGPEMIVVPVPLHPGKKRERGFNQAELLARDVIRVVRRLEPAVRMTLAAGLLHRTRATQSQTVLTTVQRRRNLRGAFSVSGSDSGAKIAGRAVLLIDDIYTTGATARACSKALKEAGAKEVYVATVARAQREGTIKWDAVTWDGAQVSMPAKFAVAV
jgi:ComF family protein